MQPSPPERWQGRVFPILLVARLALLVLAVVVCWKSGVVWLSLLIVVIAALSDVTAREHGRSEGFFEGQYSGTIDEAGITAIALYGIELLQHKDTANKEKEKEKLVAFLRGQLKTDLERFDWFELTTKIKKENMVSPGQLNWLRKIAEDDTDLLRKPANGVSPEAGAKDEGGGAEPHKKERA